MLFIKHCRSWPVAPNFATNTWCGFAGIDLQSTRCSVESYCLESSLHPATWSNGLAGSHSHVTTIAPTKRFFDQLELRGINNTEKAGRKIRRILCATRTLLQLMMQQPTPTPRSIL
jgi:hypothetical protein